MKMHSGMFGQFGLQSAGSDASGWVIGNRVLKLRKPKMTAGGTIYQDVVNDF